MSRFHHTNRIHWKNC